MIDLAQAADHWLELCAEPRAACVGRADEQPSRCHSSTDRLEPDWDALELGSSPQWLPYCGHH